MERPGETVARRVREEREGAGLSLAELARRLRASGYKMDASGIMRLERGERRPVVDDVFALALALDVSPVDLMVPLDDDAMVAVTPQADWLASRVRDWMIGGTAAERTAALAVRTFARNLLRMIEHIDVDGDGAHLAGYVAELLGATMAQIARGKLEPDLTGRVPFLDDDLQQAALDDEGRKGGVRFRDEQGRWWQDTPTGPVLVAEDADVERGIS